MHLAGDTSSITRPGQFVQIQLPGFFLRRPISVCDWKHDELTLIYKSVGQGTGLMTSFPQGMILDVLTGLGNGFDTGLDYRHPLLIGGGVGTPPLYALCKRLCEAGITPAVLLGFASRDDIILADEFKALDVKVMIVTEDGASGKRGLVTDPMTSLIYDYFFACGPEPMLKAVCHASSTSGQLSFEARMACGFGACMGCSCQTKLSEKRICKEGPVLVKEEMIW
jgi:dihydroorotate dehydrogenase electron transfer subunit